MPRQYAPGSDEQDPGLRVVLHPVTGDARPRAFPALVDRVGRDRERCASERTQGNGNDVRPSVDPVDDRRAAIWTELVGEGAAAVSRADEGAEVAADLNTASREARLRRECAACPALALEAVTDRHAQGFASAFGPQAPAAAVCYSNDAAPA